MGPSYRADCWAARTMPKPEVHCARIGLSVIRAPPNHGETSASRVKGAGSAPRLTVTGTNIDAPDANALADFYRRLLGW